MYPPYVTGFLNWPPSSWLRLPRWPLRVSAYLLKASLFSSLLTHFFPHSIPFVSLSLSLSVPALAAGCVCESVCVRAGESILQGNEPNKSSSRPCLLCAKTCSFLCFLQLCALLSCRKKPQTLSALPLILPPLNMETIIYKYKNQISLALIV